MLAFDRSYLMPSDRKQFNVRIPPGWDDERIERLAKRLQEHLNVEVSRTSLVFWSLAEAEKRLTELQKKKEP